MVDHEYVDGSNMELIDVTYEEVADGYVIDGLKPGYMPVAEFFAPLVIQRNDEGMFWPYTVRLAMKGGRVIHRDGNVLFKVSE